MSLEELGKETAPTLETGVARGVRALRFEFASTVEDLLFRYDSLKSMIIFFCIAISISSAIMSSPPPQSRTPRHHHGHRHHLASPSWSSPPVLSCVLSLWYQCSSPVSVVMDSVCFSSNLFIVYIASLQADFRRQWVDISAMLTQRSAASSKIWLRSACRGLKSKGLLAAALTRSDPF